MMPIFINKTAISYIEICIPNFDAANNYEIAFYFCKLQSITYDAAIMANNAVVLTDLTVSVSQPLNTCICATEIPVATQPET